MPPAATAQSTPVQTPCEQPKDLCAYWRDRLCRAEQALAKITSSAVESYTVGSRSLKRLSLTDAAAAVDYCRKRVELYCGEAPLPSSLTGRDSACRIISRDV
jgi:hypothetical protein